MKTFPMLITIGITVSSLLLGCQQRPDNSAPSPEAQAALDIAAVQSVMQDYIERATDAGGTMTIQGMQATFDHLHEGLETREGLYASCADFTTPDGNTYDLDYYVDASGGDLEVAKVVFHKKNGESVNEVFWTRDQQR